MLPGCFNNKQMDSALPTETKPIVCSPSLQRAKFRPNVYKEK